MFVAWTQDIASGQIRTDDLRFTKPLLYHLSYAGLLNHLKLYLIILIKSNGLL